MSRRRELLKVETEEQKNLKMIEKVERRLGAKPTFRKNQWVKIPGGEVGRIVSVHLSGKKRSRNRKKYAVVFFANRSHTARTRTYWFDDLKKP
jgi:hypothetical protein